MRAVRGSGARSFVGMDSDLDSEPESEAGPVGRMGREGGAEMSISTSRYTRKRPSVVRTLWTNRHLLVAFFMIVTLVWFMIVNDVEVAVSFPLGLGGVTATSGMLVLGSFLSGAVTGVLAFAGILAWRKLRGGDSRGTAEDEAPTLKEKSRDDFGSSRRSADREEEDLPPPDYAAKTPEGFSSARWN